MSHSVVRSVDSAPLFPPEKHPSRRPQLQLLLTVLRKRHLLVGAAARPLEAAC